MNKISLEIFKNEELIMLLLSTVIIFIALFLIFKIPFFKRKKEYFLITFITLVFSLVTFTKLGTTNYPKTFWQAKEDNENFVLEVVSEDTKFDQIYVIGGEGDNNALDSGYQVWFNDITISGSNDLKTWENITTLSNKSDYLGWFLIEGDYNYKYLSFDIPSFRSVIHEFGIKQKNSDEFLDLKLISYNSKENTYSPEFIFDETDTIPTVLSSNNTSYFDEIYHARNALEIANNQDMYASVHPLLGTTIMSLGIKVFGMNPFGWRFMGALFGVLIIPMFYALARKLFNNNAATFASALLAFDFMTLTTSRIATLEPFSIFFILLMTYYMVCYLKLNFDAPLKKLLLPLLCSGIAMGLAIATKWTGVYAAVGLGILFFIHFYKQLKLINFNTKHENYKKGIKIILYCFLFFIFIPLAIYCISYIPTRVWKNDTWSIENVYTHSIYMYNYHANLQATHPYQSTWYQWLFDIQPIWYFIYRIEDTFAYSISCFNNPLISWTGVISIIYTIYSSIKEKTNSSIFIIICYLSALIPWVLVSRCVFSYHYYPALPFLILAITYFFEQMKKRFPIFKNIQTIYLILVILLFILFLPATAGFKTTLEYLNFLSWLPSWYFGA
ncbi:MAG: phospholipid carrier-dependent glycosyltransferase [Anaerorhabdus sp.]